MHLLTSTVPAFADADIQDVLVSIHGIGDTVTSIHGRGRDNLARQLAALDKPAHPRCLIPVHSDHAVTLAAKVSKVVATISSAHARRELLPRSPDQGRPATAGSASATASGPSRNIRPRRTNSPKIS
jgi:hypothetical protein